MANRQLRLRRADQCRTCSLELPVGSTQWWDSEARAVTCGACHEDPTGRHELPRSVGGPLPETPVTPTVIGDGGASAQREYERRSARELARKTKAVADDTEWRARIKAERPVLGRLAAAVTAKPMVTPESQDTVAWAVGAAGERRVAEVLASCVGVYALHDRRVPGSKANIDHIAVSPSGVYVIDAKKYEGAVEARDVGAWLRSDVRLYVNGRDRTKLADAMLHQVEVVARAAAADSAGISVRPVLCFVSATWPRFRRRTLSIRGVTVVWPDALGEIVSTPVGTPSFNPAEVAEAIAQVLLPA